jgi:toluene monooxygenase system ferredoxin subunit
MAYHRVTTLAELWSGDLVGTAVGGVRVLVLRIGDGVHAYEDRCAHLGFELSRGTLDGRVLTCSAHHWQYDATTGRGINPAMACLRPFAIKVEDGVVYVDVDRVEPR